MSRDEMRTALVEKYREHLEVLPFDQVGYYLAEKLLSDLYDKIVYIRYLEERIKCQQ